MTGALNIESRLKDMEKWSKQMKLLNEGKLRPMSCPSCGTVLDDNPDFCRDCSFSFEVAKKQFSFQPPPMETIIDPLRSMPPSVQADIRRIILDFQRYTPQIEIAFCVLKLDPKVSLSEFGFWFINAAPPRHQHGMDPRGSTVLLLLDAKNHRASITSGYALDPFISDADWERLLHKSRKHFEKKRYPKAIKLLLLELNSLLHKRLKGLNYVV